MPEKREEFELNITQIQFFSSFYGDKEMIAGVLNGTPHRFVWWNSSKPEQFQEGVVRVVATVKEHSTHEQYGKQTVLTHVKPAKEKVAKQKSQK